jgi:hypothetical protein
MKIAKSEIQTIHKSNKLIQTTSPQLKKLNANSLILLDNLYFQLQMFINEYKRKNGNKLILKKNFTISIKQTNIREWLGLENTERYTEEIRTTIKKLTQPIELKNYVEDGEKIRWGIKHFIKNVKEKRDQNDNKTILYNITIDTFLFETVLNLKDNFTKIDFRENIKKVLKVIIQ